MGFAGGPAEQRSVTLSSYPAFGGGIKGPAKKWRIDRDLPHHRPFRSGRQPGVLEEGIEGAPSTLPTSPRDWAISSPVSAGDTLLPCCSVTALRGIDPSSPRRADLSAAEWRPHGRPHRSVIVVNTTDRASFLEQAHRAGAWSHATDSASQRLRRSFRNTSPACRSVARLDKKAACRPQLHAAAPA